MKFHLTYPKGGLLACRTPFNFPEGGGVLACVWVIVVEYYYRIGIYAKYYRYLNKANLYYSPFVICTPLLSEGLGEAFLLQTKPYSVRLNLRHHR